MELRGVAPVILGLLRRGPMSGYDIKAWVDRSTRFFWAASYGQIYPELRRLEGERLIEGEDAPRGERPRRVFRLTDAGEQALERWREEPDMGYALRDLGLLKLFFTPLTDSEATLNRLGALEADRLRVLEELKRIAETVPRDARYPSRLVLEFGLEYHEWIVDWCRRTERRLTGTRAARRKGQGEE